MFVSILFEGQGLKYTCDNKREWSSFLQSLSVAGVVGNPRTIADAEFWYVVAGKSSVVADVAVVTVVPDVAWTSV